MFANKKIGINSWNCVCSFPFIHAFFIDIQMTSKQKRIHVRTYVHAYVGDFTSKPLQSANAYVDRTKHHPKLPCRSADVWKPDGPWRLKSFEIHNPNVGTGGLTQVHIYMHNNSMHDFCICNQPAVTSTIEGTFVKFKKTTSNRTEVKEEMFTSFVLNKPLNQTTTLRTKNSTIHTYNI